MPQTPNPFPLSIEEKQDSWDKLQLLANVDSSFKYYASEFNKIVQGLNYLYELLTSDGSSIQIFNINVTTDDVTVFNVTPSPSAVKVVFLGRTHAIPNTDYTYEQGLITFSRAPKNGTIITIVY